MKNLIILLSLFAFSFVNAQNTVVVEESRSHMETFSDGRTTHGVGFGITTHLSKFNDEYLYLVGAKLTYIMDRKVEIGFAGTALYSESALSGITSPRVNLWGGYGGLHIAPIIGGNKKMHIAFPVTIGGGAIGYSEQKLRDLPDWDLEDEDYETFFIVEPGVDVVLNITNFFQIELGGKYRFTDQIDLQQVDTKDLDGFSAGIGLKFGIL